MSDKYVVVYRPPAPKPGAFHDTLQDGIADYLATTKEHTDPENVFLVKITEDAKSVTTTDLTVETIPATAQNMVEST